MAVASLVGGFEMFLRARGYQPSVKDDPYAWAWQRTRAADASPRTVALLGSSRIMLAFAPSAFAAELPGWKYVQLGIAGTTAVGSLWDLADDDAFRGVAIVDITEPAFYRVSWHAQDEEIGAYHRRWRAVGSMLERVLATEVQSRLAVLAVRGIETLGKLWRTGAWPNPRYVTMHADRTRFADFSLLDLERQRRVHVELVDSWNTDMRDPAGWLAEAMEIEPAIARIQARGGQVIYVRMPTCGERWEADEKQAPKARFWDALAAKTRAVTIHFKDDPVLASFACPDTSHLDSKDGPAFTAALIRAMKKRGVFH